GTTDKNGSTRMKPFLSPCSSVVQILSELRPKGVRRPVFFGREVAEMARNRCVRPAHWQGLSQLRSDIGAMIAPESIAAFITKWEISGAAERANAQLFLSELCGILDVPKPEPTTPDDRANAYVFEKNVPSAEGTSNFIDCYNRGCFVLDTKQGADAVGIG